MKKLRYGAMAVTIAVGVGGFLLAQRADIIPGPWSANRPSLIYSTRQMLADRTADYMSHYRRGLEFAKHRELEKALADLNEAVRLRPTPVSLETLGARANDSLAPETHTLHLVVLVHAARADILQQMNRPEEALADLDQALAFDKRKLDIFYQRAMLRMATGRHQDAVADFDILLDKRRTVEWTFGRGVAKYLQSDWHGAIKDFESAARTISTNETYLIWMAKTYLRAGIKIPTEALAAIGSHNDARYVIEAYMSDHNPAQLMSGVRAGAAYVAHRRRGVQCETALFMGEWLVLRKKGAGAHDMFKEAATSCKPLSIEHTVAITELGRLKR